MLSQVLTLLEQHQGGLGAREISRRLGLPPGVLGGMLELLVSQGRLAKVEACETACGACPLQAECNLLAGRQSRYLLVQRRRPGRHTSAPNGDNRHYLLAPKYHHNDGLTPLGSRKHGGAL